MGGQSFFQQVWSVVKTIPKGKVSTYGEIARILGTRDARRVGQALHANRDPLIPCHRVVLVDGSLASGYAFGGAGKQRDKLEKEGIAFTKRGKVDLLNHKVKLTCQFLLEPANFSPAEEVAAQGKDDAADGEAKKYQRRLGRKVGKVTE